jgi:hypothetical protein
MLEIVASRPEGRAFDSEKTMGLKKARLKAHTQSSIIPLFHRSMWLTKRMAAIRTVIPIVCRNFDTFNSYAAQKPL